ncbi:MAG TPA: DNA polymerase III subunit gamma/tau [Bellilinea sp.]|nr:DNA polymerase III subunit gamma/tau [Bellilinea sp.]
MAQALYRKWRPQVWADVVGQDHIVTTLKNTIKGERVGHAYLFAGPRGTGKTTSARLLAKAVNCTCADLSKRPCDECENCLAVNRGNYLDLIEIDAASNTSVEDIRSLRDKINFSPSQGKYKVYIIDEVHMLSQAAFNALLKTLEEPPAHAIFILATTEIHKIPATVLSRCQRYEFRRIPVTTIVDYLRKMAAEENLKVNEDALTLIARQSTGAMRDAVSLLDQLSSSEDVITLALTQSVLGTATQQVIVDLASAILDGDAARGLEMVHTALESGSDPRQFARQIVEYLRNILLIKLGSASQVDATSEQLSLMKKQAGAFNEKHLLACIDYFNTAANEIRTGWQPSLPLELAVTRSVMPQNVAEQTAAQPAAQEVVKPTPPVKKEVPKPVPAVKAQPAPEEESPWAEEVKAAAVSKAESKPAKPVTPGEVSTAALQAGWDEIKAYVKQRHVPTQGLLNSCRNPQVVNGTVRLGFSSEILKTKMEQNISIFQEALEKVLGWKIPVLCLVGGGKAAAADPEFDADGMLQTLQGLGAKINKKKSTPNE